MLTNRFTRTLAVSALVATTATPSHAAPKKTEHVVMIVWDGLRPDSVTAQNTPVLHQLAKNGVTFANHHPVYPSSTEVNGTALATGMYPVNSHIIGNKEYRPDIDPLKPVGMEELAVIRKGDEKEPYIAVPTVAETVQGASSRTTVAGTKPVSLLADRSDKKNTAAAQASSDVFEGKAIPTSVQQSIIAAQGEFPPDITFPNTKADTWTTQALTQTLWKTDVPKYSVLWLSDVDYTQHETAPGSPTSLAALKSCDAQLDTVLKTLDAKGVRDTTTVMVVSDHGFSTISRSIDIVSVLTAAGFNAKAKLTAPLQTGEIMVVPLGGSVYFYVGGHDAAVQRKLVEFLQGSDFAGVLFSRDGLPGTFGLDKININSAGAPDVAMAFRWDGGSNAFGLPGMLNADFKRKVGQGNHASLSRFDMHNTLIAAGPELKKGFVDQTPSGNTDLAPTVLYLLGIAPTHRMDGRVLGEALAKRDKSLPKHVVTKGKWETQSVVNGKNWSQYVVWKKTGETIYFDEGNSGSGAVK